MKKVGIADLKAKLSEQLRTVRRGGEITIMDRDQPIARIVPYAAAKGLAVREPLKQYKTLAEIPMPPAPAHLDVDVVDLLLQERNAR